MKITWFGHAAFLLEGETERGESRRVILDPYNHPLCGGYLPVDESADLVCVSHDNVKYHSDTSAIRGDFTLVRALDVANPTGAAPLESGYRVGTRIAREVPFDAIEVFETADRAGPNAMVRVVLDGVRLVHQGDLGHALEGEALEFQRADVLLALAGGAPTIALDDLVEAIDRVRPRIVIPMHFRTPKVNLAIRPLEDFLDAIGDRFPVDRAPGSVLEVTREQLPDTTRIVVLDHAR